MRMAGLLSGGGLADGRGVGQCHSLRIAVSSRVGTPCQRGGLQDHSGILIYNDLMPFVAHNDLLFLLGGFRRLIPAGRYAALTGELTYCDNATLITYHLLPTD